MVLTSHNTLGNTGRATVFTIPDGPLVTGQNPASSVAAAQALPKVLK
jgi:putative intracellular protease/amidase